MPDSSGPVVIAGGGLAGGLAALALAHRRPDLPILLVEEERSFGGNHVWSFFDSDIRSEDRWLLELLSPMRWPRHEVRFPDRHRQIAIGYNSVTSAQLDAALRNTLGPNQLLAGRKVVEVNASGVFVEGEGAIRARAVLDCRGAGPARGLELGWQKFLGRLYAFDRPHGQELPTIMDATVEQIDGFRFVYTLPFSETELLIEDTYYSDSPELNAEVADPALAQKAAMLGPRSRILNEEHGLLPVVLGGSVGALWREDDGVARLGMRGGFFHPTTGYSLPDAVRNAVLLVRYQEMSSPALHRLFRERAERLWAQRRFFRLLNRMLFRAAEPRQRYRVLEHFYRLPEVVIGRFYSADLTALDKLRILSGRPPVPVPRAIAAMAGAGS